MARITPWGDVLSELAASDPAASDGDLWWPGSSDARTEDRGVIEVERGRHARKRSVPRPARPKLGVLQGEGVVDVAPGFTS